MKKLWKSTVALAVVTALFTANGCTKKKAGEGQDAQGSGAAVSQGSQSVAAGNNKDETSAGAVNGANTSGTASATSSSSAATSSTSSMGAAALPAKDAAKSSRGVLSEIYYSFFGSKGDSGTGSMADGKSVTAGAANPNQISTGIGAVAVGGSAQLGGGEASNTAAQTTAAAAPGAPGQPGAPEPSCYTITYKHKKMAAHTSDETCSHHKNLLKLKHELVNPKSVCVRVNGTPVRFQILKSKADEIVIGPIAGPEATITARYCVAKMTCAEDCTVPKDEFLDAIGGSDNSNEAVQISHWDADDTNEKNAKETAKLNEELKKELQDIENTAPGTAEGISVFKDWVSESEGPACAGTKHAGR